MGKSALYNLFAGEVRKVLSCRHWDADAVGKVLLDIPNINCEDQYVGNVSDFDLTNPYAGFPRRDDVRALRTKRFKSGIVVILESPNKYEFKKIEGNPVSWESNGPARGCTGCRLREHWPEISEKEHLPCRTHMFLLNAVQFHCSLSWSGFRIEDGVKDEIFCRCATQVEFKKDLVQRIQRVQRICEEITVVNACTKCGCGRGYNAVTESFRSFDCKKFISTHPRSWSNPSSRWVDAI